jgi:hypothetical protein
MRRTAGTLITSALLLAACGGGSDGDTAPTVPPAGTTAPSTVASTSAPPATTAPTTTEPRQPLTINEMQVIGSHNSFHIKPQPAAFEAITAVSPELAESIDYSHRPLTEQLEQFGIRQFELDVFADPDGGLYSNRAANAVIGLDPIALEPELQLPGYKVLHTQDFDYESTCLTLVACLTEIEAWSSQHPNHLPMMIMLEIQTQSVPEAAAADGLDLTIDLPWTTPVPITSELLDSLDAEIASVFDPEQLIIPDDVRGGAATLEEAILDTGWPTIDDSRGKVLFLLNNTGDLRALYTQGRPSIEGRPMFTSATPGEPDAAFVRFDDPNSPDLEAAARAGYLIRTRTDSPTADARTNDIADRERAFASGAQFLSTDYYEPSRYFDSPYVVEFADGAVARCNPITAPPTCSPDQLQE